MKQLVIKSTGSFSEKNFPSSSLFLMIPVTKINAMLILLEALNEKIRQDVERQRQGSK